MKKKWKRKNNGGYGALLGEMDYFGGMIETEQKQNTKYKIKCKIKTTG